MKSSAQLTQQAAGYMLAAANAAKREADAAKSFVTEVTIVTTTKTTKKVVEKNPKIEKKVKVEKKPKVDKKVVEKKAKIVKKK